MQRSYLLRRQPLTHVNGGAKVLPNCAACHQPGAQHQGDDGHFYCGEFCEEGGPQDSRRQ